MALHRSLDGVEGAIPPAEWLLSCVCEAFGVPPVIGGGVDQPMALALDIMELRAYARAKQAADDKPVGGDEPTGLMAYWVTEVEWALMQERYAAMGSG